MAAPTPVSSLVHSSTLVTAVIYLIIRYGEVLEGNASLIVLSSGTILLAGWCACYENDIKKVIALSTLRQLGEMLFSLGLGSYILSFYHLLIHSMFKALLFICAGRIIHINVNIQDSRLIGGVSHISFFHRLSFIVCSLSLIGFPFIAGFYSKDLIYEYVYFSFYMLLRSFIFLVGIFFTRVYRIRLLKLAFLGCNKGLRKGVLLDDFLIS